MSYRFLQKEIYELQWGTIKQINLFQTRWSFSAPVGYAKCGDTSEISRSWFTIFMLRNLSVVSTKILEKNLRSDNFCVQE